MAIRYQKNGETNLCMLLDYGNFVFFSKNIFIFDSHPKQNFNLPVIWNATFNNSSTTFIAPLTI